MPSIQLKLITLADDLDKTTTINHIIAMAVEAHMDVESSEVEVWKSNLGVNGVLAVDKPSSPKVKHLFEDVPKHIIQPLMVCIIRLVEQNLEKLGIKERQTYIHVLYFGLSMQMI